MCCKNIIIGLRVLKELCRRCDAINDGMGEVAANALFKEATLGDRYVRVFLLIDESSDSNSVRR